MLFRLAKKEINELNNKIKQLTTESSEKDKKRD
jgi:hypothetical protein